MGRTWGVQQPEPLLALSKAGQGVGAGADGQGGQRGSAESRAETSLQSSDKPSFGQVCLGTVNVGANLWVNLSFPITALLGFCGVSLRAVLAMGQGFFIAGISSMTFIFTNLPAVRPKSHEDKGQASCIGDSF